MKVIGYKLADPTNSFWEARLGIAMYGDMVIPPPTQSTQGTRFADMVRLGGLVPVYEDTPPVSTVSEAELTKPARKRRTPLE